MHRRIELECAGHGRLRPDDQLGALGHGLSREALVDSNGRPHPLGIPLFALRDVALNRGDADRLAMQGGRSGQRHPDDDVNERDHGQRSQIGRRRRCASQPRANETRDSGPTERRDESEAVYTR